MSSYSNKDIQIKITHIPLDSSSSPQYSIINNVKTKGIEQYKISKEKVQEILDGFEEIYFFSLRDKYLSSKKESKEKVTISARLDDRFKKIECETDSNAPYSLLILIKKIEEITNIIKLIENNN